MLGRPAKFGGGLGAAAQLGAEQRRERRYKVDLPGEVQVGGTTGSGGSTTLRMWCRVAVSNSSIALAIGTAG